MKTLIKLILALASLFALALILVIIFIDPNDYKDQVQSQAKSALNRTLVIDGELGWGFYPTLSISTGKVRLLNEAGFNRDNLIEIQGVSAGIQLIPLLTGNVELSHIKLDGLRINLITNRKGKSNLDGIGEERPIDTTQRPKSSSTPDLKSLSIAGLVISDAQIESQDLVNKTTSLLNIKEITLGQFALAKTTPLTMLISLATEELSGEFMINGNVTVSEDLKRVNVNQFGIESTLAGNALPNGEVKLSLASEIVVQPQPLQLTFDALIVNANDLQLTGNASLALADKTKVRFDFNGNEWNLDQFIASKTTEETDAQSASVEQEPNLSFLNGLDVDGKVVLAGMQVSGLTIGKVVLKTKIINGVAKIAPLTAQLYQGKLRLEAEVVDGNGQNSYAVSQQLNGVAIQPLLNDLAQTTMLAGTTNMAFNATGSGLTVTKIKQKLKGQGNFEVLDGALYGINIPQKIRSAKATLTGGTEANSNQTQKTDFSSLTGQFKISDAVFNNTSLMMSAPFLRLEGNGLANIIKSSLDYRLKTTLVSTSKGQGGASEDELAGIAIPLKITGTFSDPKFSLDTSGALKSKLDQEKDRAKDKLKNKLKDKLGGLFK